MRAGWPEHFSDAEGVQHCLFFFRCPGRQTDLPPYSPTPGVPVLIRLGVIWTPPSGARISREARCVPLLLLFLRGQLQHLHRGLGWPAATALGCYVVRHYEIGEAPLVRLHDR